MSAEDGSAVIGVVGAGNPMRQAAVPASDRRVSLASPSARSGGEAPARARGEEIAVPWSSAWADSGVGRAGAWAISWPRHAMPQLICTRLSKPLRAAHGPLHPYASWHARTRLGLNEVGRSEPTKAEPGQCVGAIARARGRYAPATSVPRTRRGRRSSGGRTTRVASPRSSRRGERQDLLEARGIVRSTSAPNAARLRVHTGPAMTRVRSSTRTPASSAYATPSGARWT